MLVKPFLSTFLMTALVLCFTSKLSRGMDVESEKSLPNKRKLLGSYAPKPPSEDAKTEILLIGLIRIVYPEIIAHFDSDPIIKKAQTFKLRLVSRGFKKVIDSNIDDLDFAPYCEFIELEGDWERHLEDTKGNYFKYCKKKLFLFKGSGKPLSFSSTEDWGLCYPRREECYLSYEEALQSSWYVWTQTGERLLNPLRNYRKDIAMDLTDFLKLTKLSLGSNVAINDDALSPFTQLTSLDLASNNTITDNCLSYLINLRILNLNNNVTITHESVSCLTLLEDLDLSIYGKEEGRVELSALQNLWNLKKLTIGNYYAGIGEIIHFPRLKKLCLFQAGEPLYKTAISIADALFLYLENTEEENMHLYLSELKTSYANVLFPITSLYPDITSQFLDKTAMRSFTWEEMQVLMRLARGIYCDSPSDILAEYNGPMKQILKSLLEVSGKELEIVYLGDDSECNILDPSFEW